MKTLLLTLILMFSYALRAEELKTFVRIEKTESDLKIIRLHEGDHIPVIPGSPEIRKHLSEMSTGSEAMMKGHITYIQSHDLKELRPWFVIESLNPVSLKELGKQNQFKEVTFTPKETYVDFVRQPTWQVTTEVASAITFTTSFLMMEELASGRGDPYGRRQMRQALFLSAGTMATLLFIYDQIQGNSKP